MDQPKNVEEKELRRASPLTISLIVEICSVVSEIITNETYSY